MPQYLHPGVYVQEVPSAVKPIAGVSSSTAAFIGFADKGPVPGTILPSGRAAQPPLVTSFTEYTRTFGGFRSDSYLTYAVQAFFQNGGSSLYVIRVIPPPGSPPANNAAFATADDRYRRRRAEHLGGEPGEMGQQHLDRRLPQLGRRCEQLQTASDVWDNRGRGRRQRRGDIRQHHLQRQPYLVARCCQSVGRTCARW